MKNDKYKYDRFLEILRLLASDADVQVNSFPDFINVADEIALAFDDVYIYIHDIIDMGLLDDYQKRKIDDINDFLNNMSNDQSLWNIDSLNNANEWQIVRKLSKELIDLLRERIEVPNLDWMSFIRQTKGMNNHTPKDK